MARVFGNLTEMLAMKLTLARRAAPLFVTTMIVAAPAWAQSTSPSPGTTVTPPSMTGPSAQTSSAPSGTSHKAMPHSAQATTRQPGESMQGLVERRITELRTSLHITPAEQQPFDQFAQVMRDNAKAIDQSYQERAEKLASMSAVDNMQSYSDIEQQRAQQVQKLVPAFQALYGSLSDQQKRTADDMFRTYGEKAQAKRQASAH
jgi:protein CpxP